MLLPNIELRGETNHWRNTMTNQYEKKEQTNPAVSDKETVAARTVAREGLEILDSEAVLSAVSGGPAGMC
jgi:hypothetical protein